MYWDISFDRYAVIGRTERFQKFDPNALSKETNIRFIPLFSPHHKHCDDHREHYDDSLDEASDCDSSSHLSFNLPFEQSFSDGNLDQVHSLPVVKPTLLKEFLTTPMPVKRKQGRGPIPKGRVLTSRDNLILIEEQEKKKAEAAKLK